MSQGEQLHAGHVFMMHLWSMEQAAVLTELKLTIQQQFGTTELWRMEQAAEAAALEGRHALPIV